MDKRIVLICSLVFATQISFGMESDSFGQDESSMPVLAMTNEGLKQDEDFREAMLKLRDLGVQARFGIHDRSILFIDLQDAVGSLQFIDPFYDSKLDYKVPFSVTNILFRKVDEDYQEEQDKIVEQLIKDVAFVQQSCAMKNTPEFKKLTRLMEYYSDHGCLYFKFLREKKGLKVKLVLSLDSQEPVVYELEQSDSIKSRQRACLSFLYSTLKQYVQTNCPRQEQERKEQEGNKKLHRLIFKKVLQELIDNKDENHCKFYTKLQKISNLEQEREKKESTFIQISYQNTSNQEAILRSSENINAMERGQAQQRVAELLAGAQHVVRRQKDDKLHQEDDLSFGEQVTREIAQRDESTTSDDSDNGEFFFEPWPASVDTSEASAQLPMDPLNQGYNFDGAASGEFNSQSFEGFMDYYGEQTSTQEDFQSIQAVDDEDEAEESWQDSSEYSGDNDAEYRRRLQEWNERKKTYQQFNQDQRDDILDQNKENPFAQYPQVSVSSQDDDSASSWDEDEEELSSLDDEEIEQALLSCNVEPQEELQAYGDESSGEFDELERLKTTLNNLSPESKSRLQETLQAYKNRHHE